MNIAIVQGSIRHAPDFRELPGGERACAFELSVATPGGSTELVPVVLYGSAVSLGAGTEVVVLGRVRKRFYRAGPLTQARTEIVATKVVASRKNLQAAKLFAEAADTLKRARAV